MNDVFENFVVKALRHALGLSERAWSHGCRGHYLPLDTDGTLRLEPDFSWWIGSECVLVGDTKYKLLDEQGPFRSDLYQLMAYTVAARVGAGLLIYASGSGEGSIYTVRHLETVLKTVAIDLTGTPDDILTRIRTIADEIRSLRAVA